MIYEFSIGDWRAVVLSDNTGDGEANRMITSWTPERLEREWAAFGVTGEKVAIGYNVLAVQTPVGWVMMDGGQGPLTGDRGQLLDALAEANIAPEDIALIFLSHCHADHYGGLVHPDGSLNFPNAKYVMGRVEWELWTNDARMAEFKATESVYYEIIRQRLLPILPHLTLIAPGEVIAPGMTAIDSPGHSAGHLSLLIENGGEALLYIGDAALHPIHLKYPDSVFYNDSHPDIAPDTRRALLRLSRETGARIFACHIVFPGFCDVPEDWPVADS